MNFPDFYQPADVTDISDPEDKGRVKIKFQKSEVKYQDWVPVQDSVVSKGDNGWHGELEVGDEVLVAFIDWPTCQEPFVDKKIRSSQNSVKRAGKEFLLIKGHKIIFEDGKVTIQHKDGNDKMELSSGQVKLSRGSSTLTMSDSGTVLSMTGLQFNVKNNIAGSPLLSFELVSLIKDLINILQTAQVMTSLGPQIFIPTTQTQLFQVLGKISTFL